MSESSREFYISKEEIQTTYLRRMVQGEDVSLAALNHRAKERSITHVRLSRIEKTSSLTVSEFLTQDEKGETYLFLGSIPCAPLHPARWVELQSPMPMDLEKGFFQSDGGSIWYGSYMDICFDPDIQLIVRGPEVDEMFERVIGELIHRQYYNEQIQKVVDRERYPQ